ncbi:MAG: cytochrome c biogenesis protein CcsA [Gemmataceae bacterium]|nr:cytochrome c biogenesis protein CcsA [Gemmataceae bacterium]
MNSLARMFPWLATALGLLFLVHPALKSYSRGGPKEFDLESYARLPVLDGGRFKPIDTVARINLMIISGKQTFLEERQDGNEVSQLRQPAVKWLLDTMTSFLDQQAFDGPAMKHKVFRIENEQVLQLLGLEPRPGFRYAIDEFRGKIGDLMSRAKELEDHKDRKQYDLYDAKVVELANHLALFQQLAFLKAPLMVMPPSGERDKWYPLEPFVPPHVTMEEMKQVPTAAFHYLLLRTYADNDAKSFNEIVRRGEEIFAKSKLPAAARKVDFELFYNRFEAFHHASILYGFAFLLGCCSWMGWFRPLNLAAYHLMAAAFVVHTFGLLARMYIQDRPFVSVTNLYSSAIFIGWGCVGVGLLLEFLYRNSISIVVASAVAGITAGIVAHYLSLSGDTMAMMQAVLDTNFWLATHVTVITLGYMATFVAGGIGAVYILLGVFTPVLNRKMEDIFARDETTRGMFHGEVLGIVLSKLTYGVLCFALFMSFLGTVLGGIWADQSWGRFWGWDPKENGALLIVIWVALILHARWAGMVKTRGVAVLAVLGNLVTLWSWFGTNELGVGLHAYGGSGPLSATVVWLFVVGAIHLAVAGVGCLPLSAWQSYASGAGRSATTWDTTS